LAAAGIDERVRFAANEAPGRVVAALVHDGDAARARGLRIKGAASRTGFAPGAVAFSRGQGMGRRSKSLAFDTAGFALPQLLI